METEPKKRGRPRGNTATRDVDDELDLLIERRAREEAGMLDGPNQDAERWRESVRRYHRLREEEHRQAWVEHERHMSELHSQLALEHEERARALETE